MSDVNFDIARKHMVESQIRPWNVLDHGVLDLVARAPRQDFVPEAHRNLAYADLSLPLGGGTMMMSPRVEARLLQTAEIRPQDKILEVGTGTGFMTWLLAQLGSHVYSVEIDPARSAAAAQRLAAHNVRNVTLEVGDAANGWDRHAPYDVIILTGSVPLLPDSFQRSLAPGGRLVAVVGSSPAMTVMRIQRTGQNAYISEPVFETDLPPLKNAKAPPAFVF
jgi:protein-L-isoaspartate(D-aspartate) O-methyltransferase